MSQLAKRLAQIASNPLLQGIEKPWSPDRWVSELVQTPFGPEDYQEALASPVEALHMMDSMFVPTPILTDIAASIHKLLWDSLAQRDPRYVQKNGTFLPHREGTEKPFHVPIKPRGMLIQGITHLGKSSIVSRTLKNIPQVIERDEPAPGIKKVRQLVWLVVPSPAGTSMAAFVTELAQAIDAAMGTSYREQLRRRSTSDDFVKMLNILKDLYCGLLIIEEGQLENKLEGRAGSAVQVHSAGKRAASAPMLTSFAKMFMDVMNAGIGVVLVGNPLAFTKVLEKTQLASRLAERCFHLHPALSPDQEEWQEDYLKGIWNATCLPNQDDTYDDLARKLWIKTGGFHHALIELRKVAIGSALAAGADRVRREDIEAALNCDLGEQANMFNIFAAQDADRLGELPDVPDSYRDLWLLLRRDGAAAEGAPSSAQPQGVAAEQADRTAPPTKRDERPSGQPASKPRARARRAPSGALSPEDLRSPQSLNQFRGLADGGAAR